MARTKASSNNLGADTSETVSIRVTAAEKHLIETLAELYGEKPSPFVKQLLIDVLRKMMKHEGGPDEVQEKIRRKREAAARTSAAAVADLLASLDELTVAADDA